MQCQNSKYILKQYYIAKKPLISLIRLRLTGTATFSMCNKAIINYSSYWGPFTITVAVPFT